jgi:hypothetical protein
MAPAVDGICWSPLPSRPIVHSVGPNGGVALRWKTICDPSGDHDACAFESPSLVSWCSPEPSALTTKSSPGNPAELLR